MKDVRTTCRDQIMPMRMEGLIMNKRMVTFPEGPKNKSSWNGVPHSFSFATVTFWAIYVQHIDIPPSQPTSVIVILMFYTNLFLDLTSGLLPRNFDHTDSSLPVSLDLCLWCRALLEGSFSELITECVCWTELLCTITHYIYLFSFHKAKSDKHNMKR